MVLDQTEELSVLVMGNNPIELSRVFNNLQHVPGKRVVTEFAFDLKSAFERLSDFHPQYIVMDDNLGKKELLSSVQQLGRRRKTRHIPITILKSSNYEEAINVGVLNFILKKDLSGESLYLVLKNSMKFKRTQQYLQEAYRKRKGQLMAVFK